MSFLVKKIQNRNITKLLLFIIKTSDKTSLRVCPLSINRNTIYSASTLTLHTLGIFVQRYPMIYHCHNDKRGGKPSYLISDYVCNTFAFTHSKNMALLTHALYMNDDTCFSWLTFQAFHKIIRSVYIYPWHLHVVSRSLCNAFMPGWLGGRQCSVHSYALCTLQGGLSKPKPKMLSAQGFMSLTHRESNIYMKSIILIYVNLSCF